MNIASGTQPSSATTPLSRAVGYFLIVTLAVPLTGSQTVSVGSAGVILLAPLIISSMWSLKQVSLTLVAAVAATMSGVLLLLFNVNDVADRSVHTAVVFANSDRATVPLCRSGKQLHAESYSRSLSKPSGRI